MHALLLTLGTLVLLPAAQAQGIVKGPVQQARPNAKPAGKQAKQPRIPKVIPNPQIERLQKMTPEERDQALVNVPPERRQQIERRLAQLDLQLGRLSDQQRQEFDDRVQVFQALPLGRRQAVREELQYMKRLKPRDRQAVLAGDDFAQRFSPEEQKLIREVIAGQPQQ
jgi:uncharacterized protein DUF3106